jgi:prepilin-type N-terminal cleavage/methylation domain-containing protein
MNLANGTKRSSGFSLVEMLVVIAVIGVVAAIAVPSVRNVNRSDRYALDQHNAQQVAAVVASAQAARYDFINGSTSVDTIINRVRTGHSITAAENPTRAGTFLGVPGLGAVERTGAGKFLTIIGDRLVYDADLTPVTDAYYN